ncbi:hypothetical protein ACL1IT_13290 [Corynebacterium striatum]|uniref:hypothetical protein n=1 Tax=Corynebacterium striatum TaxID=43770 RepID=UPI001A18EDCB|nr:hypothetical protein [Corynebacterium striatum]HAT1303557.1 hypothetical protein [Corynebacterium striatum]HAT1392291.1 hypothetical protein [Corynebacterium striatum]HAT1477338.1 hypothetical protein [Corynebacterium striatum]HAT6526628.1 hypothetical protein [Corynebacterium striatum]
MEHSTQLLKDLESAINKTHEGILDLLHAIGKIYACETEYVHTVDGLAEVEATAQEETAATATPETPSAQPAATSEDPAQQKDTEDPEPVEAPEEPAPAAAVYKLEDARAELAKLTRAGRADEARKILASFNAHKLSEVSKEHYGDIIQAVKDIA